jgi:tRNA threonylcarbamoyladenosine biosynthesis protein TsaE
MAEEKLIKKWDGIKENQYLDLIKDLKSILKTPAAIILTGPVGVGKTTFTKYFVDKVDEVLSPTYSLINEAGEAAHADFYRIEEPEEVVHLELNLYIDDKKYFLIEWGKPFIEDIKRNLTDEYGLYELVFDAKDLEGPRNICLYELK